MDHVLELVLLGASLLFISVVIFSGSSLTTMGSNFSKGFSNKVNDRNVAIEENKYTIYENDTCTGSDVVSAIRQFKDELIITVTVYSAQNSTHTFDTVHDIGDSFQNLPTSNLYINPAAQFKGKVVRTQSGAISGLMFKQTAWLNPTHTSNTTGNAGTSGTVNGAISSTSWQSGNFNSAGVRTEEKTVDKTTDLDVFFSDDEKEGTAESAQVAKNLSDDFATFGSQLDDLIEGLDNNSSLADVQNISKSLNTLNSNLDTLKAKCKDPLLSREQQNKFLSAYEEIGQRVQKAFDVIFKLQKKLQADLDTKTMWHIGYPVKTAVVAKLDGGVLSFSGQGKVMNLGHQLPAWLHQKDKIIEVKFNSGVAPSNLDYWFSGCYNLQKVSAIPNSVVSVNGTFEGCKKLKSISLGENIISANTLWSGGKQTLEVTVPKGSVSINTLKECAKLLNDNLNIKERDEH